MILLVAAGLLKASEEFTEAYHFGVQGGVEGGVHSASVFLGSVCEVGFGLFLWQNRSCRFPWFAAAAVFLVFAFVSLLKGLDGMQTCDCFGAIAVRPYYTAVMDLLIAIACLASFAFLYDSGNRLSVSRVVSVRSLLFVLAFLSSSVGVLYAREAWLPADVLAMFPVVGSLRLAETEAEAMVFEGDLLLTSRQGSQVRILGYRANCSLKLIADFPLGVSASHVNRVPIRIRRPQDAAVALVPVTLFVDKSGSLVEVTLMFRA